MGHGNCIGVFDKGSSPLLIDCGTRNDNKIRNFTNLIKCQLEKVSNRDLIITHYHFDHYSLLDNLPNEFFDNVYLPALPRVSQTARAMLNFMALAIVLRYEKYYLTSRISSAGKNIRCLVKNSPLNVIGRDWKVLWPDYQIIDKRNRIKIRTIINKINKIREKLSDEQLQEFDNWYNYLSRSFSEKPKKPDNFPEKIQKNNEIDREIKKDLMSVEKIFKDIANRASLVVRDVFFEFLFTGDVDDIILDNHLNFGNYRYFLIEAPHHGGYYGYAFDNVSTEILVISRKVNYKPRCEFLRDLPWRFLVDTAKTGNCIIL